MARLSSIIKDQKRRKLVLKFKNKRLELKKKFLDPNISFEEREAIQKKIQDIPRNASPIRVRNRCMLTGRPRGVYRQFGLSRIKFRELAHQGLIPGVTKASW